MQSINTDSHEHTCTQTGTRTQRVENTETFSKANSQQQTWIWWYISSVVNLFFCMCVWIVGTFDDSTPNLCIHLLKLCIFLYARVVRIACCFTCLDSYHFVRHSIYMFIIFYSKLKFCRALPVLSTLTQTYGWKRFSTFFLCTCKNLILASAIAWNYFMLCYSLIEMHNMAHSRAHTHTRTCTKEGNSSWIQLANCKPRSNYKCVIFAWKNGDLTSIIFNR